MTTPNIYDIEGQRGALGQQYVSAQTNYTTAITGAGIETGEEKNIKAQIAELKRLSGLSGDAGQEARFQRYYGISYQSAYDTIAGLPTDIPPDYYKPNLHNWNYPLTTWQSKNPKLYPFVKPAETIGLFNDYSLSKNKALLGIISAWHAIPIEDYNAQIKALEGKLVALQPLRTEKIATANAQYQPAVSNAMGQYDQLKFQREKALNAVRSGRMQERLRDNPYKVL